MSSIILNAAGFRGDKEAFGQTVGAIATITEITTFFEAGYEKRVFLEGVLGITLKVISNYVKHVAETPGDEPFVPYFNTAQL